MPRPKTIDAAREALIIERRASRVSFQKIGDEIGLSAPRVHEIFQEVQNRIPAQRIGDLRAEESDLADRAIANLLEIAENTNVSPRTRAEAWNSIRGWSESKRKLFGVDAPTRREITVVSNETIDMAIVELTKEMAAMEAQAKAAGIKVDA